MNFNFDFNTDGVLQDDDNKKEEKEDEVLVIGIGISTAPATTTRGARTMIIGLCYRNHHNRKIPMKE